MSSLKYFCNQCGYVCDKPVDISQHLLKCNNNRDQRLERLKKSYQKGMLWFEQLVIRNSKAPIIEIESEFKKTYNAIVCLYNILLVDNINNEDVLSSRADYLEKLSNLYAEALAIQISNRMRKTKISAFLNSTDSATELESETMSVTTAETEITDTTISTEVTESTVASESPEQKSEFARPAIIRQPTLQELIRLRREAQQKQKV